MNSRMKNLGHPLCAVAALLSAIGTAQAAEDDSPRSALILEEIVVTAQKRIERLIDVPQAVTVLSANDLNKAGITQIRDFADTVPGLGLNTTGAGYTTLTMRGVTAGIDITPTVAVYVDEVPVGTVSFPTASRLALDVGLFGLDRIEVLRGPQGTLYGASSLGGLIKYVTQKPDASRFGVDVQTGVSSTHGGGLNYSGALAVNAPIVADKLAMRASASYAHDGGYIDNLARGKDDVNRSDIYSARADLLFTPTEALSVRLTGFSQHLDRDGQGTADYNHDGTARDGLLDQRRFVDEPFEQRFNLFSGEVNYDFGQVELTSISSYQTMDADFGFDLTALWVPIAASVGRSYSAVHAGIDMKAERFAQELRLTSESGRPLEWVIGGFYTYETIDDVEETTPFDLAGQPVRGALGGLLRPKTYEEYAAFGDLTWHLTDRLRATGGLRYANSFETDKQTITNLFGTVVERSSEFREDVVTYLANVLYSLNNRANLYVRYATGYRPGGPNSVATDPITGIPLAPPNYEADDLESYEIGFKGETEDRRFGIDLAAYYIDWNNIQLSAIRSNVGVRVNARDGATVRGAELALTARPASGLIVVGTGAYTNARLGEANADIGSAEGERLPNVPHFKGALSADYTFANRWEPTVGMTLRHVGERWAGFDASTSFPQYRLDAYSAVDLRVGIDFGSVTTQFFVRNLFDELGQTTMFNWNRAYAQPGIIQPRTIGLTVTTQF